jgi:hypothetical protein
VKGTEARASFVLEAPVAAAPIKAAAPVKTAAAAKKETVKRVAH